MKHSIVLVVALLSIVECSVPRYPNYKRSDKRVVAPDIVVIKQDIRRKDLRGEHIMYLPSNMSPLGNHIILEYNGGEGKNEGFFFEFNNYNYRGLSFAGVWKFSGDTIVLINQVCAVNTSKRPNEWKENVEYIKERKLLIKRNTIYDVTDYLTFEFNKINQRFQTLILEDPVDPEDSLFMLELLEMDLDLIREEFGTTLKYKFIMGKNTLQKWRKRHITVSPYVGF